MTSANSLLLILRRLDEIERKIDRIVEELRMPTAISYSVRRGRHVTPPDGLPSRSRATPRESGLKRPYGRRQIAISGLPDASFTASAQVFLTLSTTFCGIGM